MSEEMVLGFVLPVVFTLVGSGLLISAIRYYRRTVSFLANAVETTGKVIGVKEVPPMEAGDPITYRPVVTFQVADSWNVTFESIAHSSPPEHRVGDVVRVLYRRDDPHEARIHSFTSLWLLAIILGGLGLVFTLLGVGLLAGVVPV